MSQQKRILRPYTGPGHHRQNDADFQAEEHKDDQPEAPQPNVPPFRFLRRRHHQDWALVFRPRAVLRVADKRAHYAPLVRHWSPEGLLRCSRPFVPIICAPRPSDPEIHSRILSAGVMGRMKQPLDSLGAAKKERQGLCPAAHPLTSDVDMPTTTPHSSSRETSSPRP
jgi:hypothetical protein